MKHTALYDILGVRRDATTEEIVSAYRTLCRRIHPDAGGGADEFEQATRAKDVLSDPMRRIAYDMSGDLSDDVEKAREDKETVRVMISNMINEALLKPQDVDLDRTHAMKQVYSVGVMKMTELQAQIRDIRVKERRLTTILERSRFSQPVSDQVRRVLETQKLEVEAALKQHRRHEINLRQALAAVAGTAYEISVEEKAPPGFFVDMQA